MNYLYLQDNTRLLLWVLLFCNINMIYIWWYFIWQWPYPSLNQWRIQLHCCPNC